MGDVVVGTCSWTDKTMVERWYPQGVSSAEERLRYYAARFDTVEVDSSFYGIPKVEYARNWASRTPESFTFHVKAFGMMTGHEVDERALHPDLADAGYNYEITTRGRVRNAPERMVEHAFELFVQSIEPLVTAGKMGGVLMQYPPWFTAADKHHRLRNMATIERDAALLAPLDVFVEFRHASWLSESNLHQTMRFLADKGLTYVAVDAPQVGSALPPVVAATAPLGYVRMHGRNTGTWDARTASAADRFDYVYNADELAEWVPRVSELADRTERTWVMFNNCKYDYAPRNARELAAMLGDLVAPRAGGVRTGDPVSPDSQEPEEPDAAQTPPEVTQLGLGI